jgi:bifunctional diaminopimelate decarboxylase / aspartate kinase
MVKYTILKFGGSSFTEDKYPIIFNQIKKNVDTNIVVVVSAIQNTTNMLWKIIDYKENTFNKIKEMHLNISSKLKIDTTNILNCLSELNKSITEFTTEFTVQNKIKIISYGEILSSIVLTEYLNKNSAKCKCINARNFIRSKSLSKNMDTFNLHLNGEFVCNKDALLFLMDNDTTVYVTQGYIASTLDMKYCVLSRSGSDTTAALIANCLCANKVEIWTDVNGMFTADPNDIPEALLIETLNYSVAQEIAASGSAVIHPFCLKPCYDKNIPIEIHNTSEPDNSKFTTINCFSNNDPSKIYSISREKKITVFNIKTEDMWNNYGFVADIFKIFSDNSVDVNIITTSHISVSTTTNEISKEKLITVYDALNKKYSNISMKQNCNIISIIGNDIQSCSQITKSYDIINSIGREHLYIKHESSNHTNLSFVVDDTIGTKLVRSFHREFIMKSLNRVDNKKIWWRENKNRLLELVDEQKESLYVYSANDILDKCNQLKKTLTSVDKIYYAMKANNNEDILKIIGSSGFGIECVSFGEVEYARKCIPSCSILFTPNYTPIEEYNKVFMLEDAQVVIDCYQLLETYPKVFKDKTIGVRLDLDTGDGHDKKVVTEGHNVKFGMPLEDIDRFIELCDSLNITVNMIHTHKGSGVLNPKAWGRTLECIKLLLDKFTDIEYVDIGGGLGIFTNGSELDLNSVNDEIEKQKRGLGVKIIMEPGRYLVAESGVILSKVTIVRNKSNYNYVGVDVGMNVLVRPMLYDAYHPIYNISSDMKDTYTVQVVGPICESGDILGKNIKLPKNTKVDDVLLIENTGAYGKVMACDYNMRGLLKEIII